MKEFYVFATASRPAMGPTQPLSQWATGVKLSGCEAGHTPPSGAEVKMRGATPPLTHTSSWLGAWTTLPFYPSLLFLDYRHILLSIVTSRGLGASGGQRCAACCDVTPCHSALEGSLMPRPDLFGSKYWLSQCSHSCGGSESCL
jgi:hypothetical protein